MAKNPGPKLIDRLRGDYRNLPNWATNKLLVRVEKQNVDEKVEPDALGSGLIASSVVQDHTDERKKVNAYLDVTQLPISVQGQQRIADFGGLVGVSTNTLTQEPAQAPAGFGIVASETRPLGNGLVEIQTVSVTSFPIIQGVQIDSRYGVPFTYQKQIVPAGTSGGIAPDGLSATEIEPKDQWHSWRTTTSVGTLPADQVWYGRKRENLPDVLIGLTIVGTERLQAVPQWRVAPDGPMKARFTRKFSLGPPANYDPSNTATVLRPEPYNLILEYEASSVSSTITQTTSTNTSNNSGTSNSTTTSSGTSTANTTSTSNTNSSSTNDSKATTSSNTSGTNSSTSTTSSTSKQTSNSNSTTTATSNTSSTSNTTTSGTNTSDTTSSASSDTSNRSNSNSSSQTDTNSNGRQSSTTNSSGSSDSNTNGTSTTNSENTFQSDDYTNSSDAGAPTVGGGNKTFRYSSGTSYSRATSQQSGSSSSTGSQSGSSDTTSSGTSSSSTRSSSTNSSSGSSTTRGVSNSTTTSRGTNSATSTGTNNSTTQSNSNSITDSNGTSTSDGKTTSTGSNLSVSSTNNTSTSISQSISNTVSNSNTTGSQKSSSVTSGVSTSSNTGNSNSVSTSTQKTFFTVNLPKCLRSNLLVTSAAGNFFVPATVPATLPFGDWLEVSRQSEHWKLGIWVTEIVEVYLPAYA